MVKDKYIRFLTSMSRSQKKQLDKDVKKSKMNRSEYIRFKCGLEEPK